MDRTWWPLAAPMVWPQTKGKAAFASFKGGVYIKQQPKSVRAEWISKETRQMSDWREALQREGRAITREVHKVRRNFQRALQEERRRRVQAVGSNIEGLLEADRVKVAWDHLTRWYCHALW